MVELVVKLFSSANEGLSSQLCPSPFDLSCKHHNRLYGTQQSNGYTSITANSPGRVCNSQVIHQSFEDSCTNQRSLCTSTRDNRRFRRFCGVRRCPTRYCRLHLLPTSPHVEVTSLCFDHAQITYSQSHLDMLCNQCLCERCVSRVLADC